MEEKLRPRVGVGIMILNEKGEVLLGKRNDDAQKASSDLHGEGTWTMPGGKLEWHDTLIDGAIREVGEEIGAELSKNYLEVFNVQDNIIPDNHYVTVGFICKNFSDTPKIMEPDEIVEWRWFDLNALPERVYPPSAVMIKAYLNKKIYN